jgi:hypothetical protein
MAQAAVALIGGLDDATTEDLYAAFGRTCTVKVGERQPTLETVIFNDHFAGEYVRMSRWLLECTLFNFASFLGDGTLGKIEDLARKAAVAKASQSPSPKDSTGSSGES